MTLSVVATSQIVKTLRGIEPLDRIAVIADTSGGISERMRATFADVINLIHASHSAHLLVLTGGDRVENSISVEPGQSFDAARDVQFIGYGGTDFGPLLSAAEDWAPDAIVYLTDLAGPFPSQAPDCPVIWAVLPLIGSKARLTAPFGTTVRLAA